MSYSIIWSPDALRTFEDRIEYLKTNWTQKKIRIFTNRVAEYLLLLKEEPLMGKVSVKRKNLHAGLIIKEVTLIYRVETLKKEIQLVLFFDNRQNPKKIRRLKS